MNDPRAIQTPSRPMNKPAPEAYALTGQTVGRPTDYNPEYTERVLSLSARKPAPSLQVIAVELGKWPQRLWEWGKAFPEFQEALNIAKARHEAHQVERLEVDGANPNAMFLLKGAHRWSDRPDLDQPQGHGEGQGKVDITIRVLNGKHKRDDAVDVEYQVVSSNSRQDADT